MRVKDKDIEFVASFLSDNSLIDSLRDKFNQNNSTKIRCIDEPIQFFDKEVEFLQSLPNEKIKRLFYSLFCFEKLHWHESGWIRFEIDELAELGGLKNLRCEDFADLVPFGLDMRVTGSKNAVTTYYSIGMMISKKNDSKIGELVKTISGLECAEKFWEVVNGTC